MKFPAPSIYFEGKLLKEIDQFCKSGQNASADDAAACGQWDFEQLNSTLNATYAKVLNSIKKSDKELAEYHAPLAAPDFVGAQDSSQPRSGSGQRDEQLRLLRREPHGGGASRRHDRRDVR
ncbi:uncharacterized protein YecT (DUF1311 family) [Paraburkholderia youngii]